MIRILYESPNGIFLPLLYLNRHQFFSILKKVFLLWHFCRALRLERNISIIIISSPKGFQILKFLQQIMSSFLLGNNNRIVCLATFFFQNGWKGCFQQSFFKLWPEPARSPNRESLPIEELKVTQRSGVQGLQEMCLVFFAARGYRSVPTHNF